MKEQKANEKTSPERLAAHQEMKDQLETDGAPEPVIAAYMLQLDACYCAFVTACALVNRLVAEGHVTEFESFPVKMEFTKLVAARINLTPQPSDIVIDSGAPFDMTKFLPPGRGN